MKEDVREVNLNRRIYCLDLRIAFLRQLIEKPSLNDREIRRRRVCMKELAAEIAKHQDIIEKLEYQVFAADILLREAEVQRKSLIRLRSTHMIQALLADYIKTKKSLEDATC